MNVLIRFKRRVISEAKVKRLYIPYSEEAIVEVKRIDNYFELQFVKTLRSDTVKTMVSFIQF